jgi:hypothetical protein
VAYHITIVIKGEIDWKANNYVCVVRGRQTNPVTLAQAIEYARACLKKGRPAHVKQEKESE